MKSCACITFLRAVFWIGQFLMLAEAVAVLVSWTTIVLPPWEDLPCLLGFWGPVLYLGGLVATWLFFFLYHGCHDAEWTPPHPRPLRTKATAFLWGAVAVPTYLLGHLAMTQISFTILYGMAENPDAWQYTRTLPGVILAILQLVYVCVFGGYAFSIAAYLVLRRGKKYADEESLPDYSPSVSEEKKIPLGADEKVNPEDPPKFEEKQEVKEPASYPTEKEGLFEAGFV